ncbi:MAG TPA: hypothetical protein VK699_09435 [Terriglobales bacterium]|jgi:hypothetical protein|nr:hypothetical protein [Terriglobales bacterium]
MSTLARHLQDAMPTVLNRALLPRWQAISDDLTKGIDLETALQSIDSNEELVEQIINVVAKFILEKEREVIERLVQGSLTLPFSDLLKYIVFASGRAEVVTTNYDRLIEFAAELAGYGVDTTFAGTVYW